MDERANGETIKQPVRQRKPMRFRELRSEREFSRPIIVISI